ncbi:hypothetical protein [Salinarimonas ramus]|uniref:Uncharacterized protein n=1 Tax=Salinarimonas ramus TaxID=690164 RepID=A0A917V3L1_9HYPH|nr:hypothetical protein [Salinarimonas ramus]GGK32613.1 hypothetical protein GCM10011322_19140 [Salinarimonas ramus]
MACGDMDDDLAVPRNEAGIDARAHLAQEMPPEPDRTRRAMQPAERLAMSRAVRALQSEPLPPMSLDDIREGLA